jgi:hypothetical protein
MARRDCDRNFRLSHFSNVGLADRAPQRQLYPAAPMNLCRESALGPFREGSGAVSGGGLCRTLTLFNEQRSIQYVQNFPGWRDTGHSANT